MTVTGLTPTPEEVRGAREEAGLTYGEAAALIYRTAKEWRQFEVGGCEMDPALWELFRVKLEWFE